MLIKGYRERQNSPIGARPCELELLWVRLLLQMNEKSLCGLRGEHRRTVPCSGSRGIVGWDRARIGEDITPVFHEQRRQKAIEVGCIIFLGQNALPADIVLLGDTVARKEPVVFFLFAK